MYTRCPGCSTVHPVNAALLARSGGQYRCGKCNKTSNALEALFDDWPEAGRKPPGRGDTPVLGLDLDLEKASESRLNPEDAGLTGESVAAARKGGRIGRFLIRSAWLVGGLLVGAVIIFKAAEFSGHPIVQPGEIDTLLVTTGLKEAPPPEVFRDLDMIHLVSRELAADPARPGQLRLEATIVNRASRSQPYPAIGVLLFDANGAPLATHEFEPEDYLAASSAPEAAMSPHAYLPLTLELPDPGAQAVGFELEFH